MTRLVAHRRRGATLQPAMTATTEHDAKSSLLAIASRHKTLEEVVRWSLAATPPRLIQSVVVQDEYTHDVVVPGGSGLYLVYDTT